MRGMKIAVIGAGSTYTPELVSGFIDKKDSINVDELYFMDIDKKKMGIVSGIAGRMLSAARVNIKILQTNELERAIEGANYVLGQVRVGGLDARIRDEKIPLKYDLIGQETTGAGGFMSALRTIPVMINIARIIEKSAPDAWMINFSNPSGIIAEALINHSNVKVIGLCNGPTNMIKAVKEKIPYYIESFDYDIVGLNHLCWITRINVNGRDIAIKDLYSEKGRKNKRYDDSLIEATAGYSSSYLDYYYFRDEELSKLKNKAKTRGEECREIEEELQQIYMDPSVNSKPKALDKRGGALYSNVAVSLIDAIENDRNEMHVVNVKNNNVYGFMDENDVVETKCIINKNGAIPVKIGEFNNYYIKGMMKVVKAYEKLTIDAALDGDYAKALAALMVHPLIGDYCKAKGVLDEMMEANREYLPQFFRTNAKI